MKNLLILLLSFLSFAVLPSCDKDDDPQPQPQSNVSNNNDNTVVIDSSAVDSNDSINSPDNNTEVVEAVIVPTNDTIYFHPHQKESSDSYHGHLKYPATSTVESLDQGRVFGVSGEHGILFNDIKNYVYNDTTLITEDRSIYIVDSEIEFVSSISHGPYSVGPYEYGPYFQVLYTEKNWVRKAHKYGWVYVWSSFYMHSRFKYTTATYNIHIELNNGMEYTTQLIVRPTGYKGV